MSEFLQDRQHGSETKFSVKVGGCTVATPQSIVLLCNQSSTLSAQVDQLSVAFGHRAFPRLVEVLSLPELDDDSCVKCLKLLLTLTSSQASCIQSNTCTAQQLLCYKRLQSTAPLT